MNYIAPPWLPGGNLQTIWTALYARKTFVENSTQGRLPGHVRSMPDAVGRWLLNRVEFTQNFDHG